MGTTEESVGIRAYVTPDTQSFTGILRHRFSDFKVNEIDIDGNVVRLTDLEIPEDVPTAQEDAVAHFDDPEAVVVAYEAILAPDTATKSDALRQFLANAKQLKSDPSTQRPLPVALDPVADKDRRRALHGLFKSLPWAPTLRTETVTASSEHGKDSGTNHTIEVSLVNGPDPRNQADKNGKKRKWRDTEVWPGGPSRFVRFALYKEHIETQHALSTLSSKMRLSQKTFSVAGTKDKRAVTVQWVTAFRIHPKKLAQVSRTLRNIRLGNFSYVSEQLGLGDLRGNRFEIILRGIDGADVAAIAEAAAAVRERGFLNYYGLQRFGSSDGVPTHAVGRALFRGDWEEAVRAIIRPTTTSREEVVRACNAYLEDGDAAAALAGMPKQLVAECAVLGVLSKEPSALVNALMAVPRNLRNIYMHAYQSYLWNEAVTERVLRFGVDRAVEGDLVVSRTAMQEARRAKVARHETSSAAVPDNEDDADVAKDDEVHVVTKEEAEAGRYTIDDVVLPLPGPKSVYPKHDVANVYRTLAAKDGVSLKSEGHRVKQLSIAACSGTYRHLLFRPKDLEYEILRYDDADVELATTDLKEVMGLSPPQPSLEGKYLALRLVFTLPSSTYATMLIRELTKMKTDLAFVKGIKHPA